MEIFGEDFIVERIVTATKEEIDLYVSQSRPFILTGTVEQWPAASLWKDPKYLLNKIGEDTIIPVRTNFTQTKNGVEWLGETANIPFQSFMKHWLQGKNWSKEENIQEKCYYLASLPMNKHFSALMDDVVVPIHAKEQKKSGNLWIGNAGQITPVHYDFSTGDPGMDGLHAVIIGKKLFRLYDPFLNEHLFPRKCEWGRFHQAIVEEDGLPSINTFKQFKNAKCIEIELKAGEMLFIPKLWWHHVVTLEPSEFLVSASWK